MTNRFVITLDRPTPIYYAGEVVTGSFTLKCTKEETCRSLLLSFVGKARVHWHTGSRDNRTDYDGRKNFIESQRTLHGNFYRTTVLDEAGSDATFGGAMGDNDMYIPCKLSEGSQGGPMMLIVRVCDYDWGKRDDNLGEVIIDAKKLALSGDTQTFDLTRNGKPEQGTITLAAKFLPSSALSRLSSGHIAQESSGEILVLKAIRANGLRKADWFGQNDVYVQAWRTPDNFVLPAKVGKKLPEPDKKVKLERGEKTYRFAFPTRPDSPGSAVLNCGDLAYIAYYIKAEIDKKGWRNPSYKFPIAIIPLRPVPTPKLLKTAMIEEESQIKKMKFCCFACGEAGMVSVKLMSKRSYAPGQTLNIDGSKVINSSSIPVTVRVVLKQFIRLATTGRFHLGTEGIERFEIGEKLIQAGSTETLDSLTLIIPPVPPSFFGAQGSFCAKREPLTFSYALSLQAKAKSGHKAQVNMPILISALPAKADAPSGYDGISAIHDPFEIASYAVTDDSPCDTVNLVTGFEDTNQAAIVPSATGSANIYDQEDGGSSEGYYDYSPQVVTFPSLANGNEETNASMPVSVSTNEVSHETAYNNLMEKISNEYDIRLAVDAWVKEFPMAASNLTPDQVAGVLKKVIFSLEQAAVARELTGGIGQRLTTAHIDAAMQACPYSKLEVLRVMAPYCSDPENKEKLLDHLYKFEREEASKYFRS